MVGIWIDVEDLFEYARDNARPSGIQRLAFEIYCAARQIDGNDGQIRFVRHAPLANTFRVVAWPDIENLFSRLTEGGIAATQASGNGVSRDAGRAIAKTLVYRLPLELRLRTIELILAMHGLACASWRFLGAILSSVRRLLARTARRPGRHPGPHVTTDQPDFTALVKPGDFLVVCGSPWYHPDYAAMIQRHREIYGLRFALLVYDLIPLRRPEWCDIGLVRLFHSWFTSVFPLCDEVFAISHSTARDVERYARDNNISLRSAPIVIPVGTGLNTNATSTVQSPARPLPPAGSYALIVSTIEARKNHLLLFRLWRLLLEEKPAADVPTLVFAGRVGWLVDDLLQQIKNTNALEGKLVIVESPTDTELAELYAGCLFTLFPSFYEGWGLPVSESLAMGKPCIIANRTSLPEAGGALVRSFDPDNLNDAYEVIRQVIDDPADLAAWEAQVRRNFRPTSWSETAGAIITALQANVPEALTTR